MIYTYKNSDGEIWVSVQTGIQSFHYPFEYILEEISFVGVKYEMNDIVFLIQNQFELLYLVNKEIK